MNENKKNKEVFKKNLDDNNQSIGFFDKFIQRPILASVINIVIVLLGVVSWYKLNVRELPKINFPTISIKIEYAGASSSIVESQVTIPVEEALAGLEKLDYMMSTSTNGQSHIVLYFNPDADSDTVMSDVRGAVSKAENDLPQHLRKPIISKSSLHDKELIRFVAYGKYNLSEIADHLQRNLKGIIEAIAGVASVQILGGGGGGESGTFQIHAELLLTKLYLYNVSVKDIREAIFQQSFKKPLGDITKNDISYTITLDQGATSLEDYADMIISTHKSGFVRLKDVADVKLIVDDPDSVVRYNGKPCVMVSVIPQQSANPIQISSEIKEKLEEIRSCLPKNLHLDISSDASESIKKSINAVYYSIFEAILFVFLIILLFLKSWRSTFIPMITIPICIFGGFFIIYLLNYSINKVTLLAMVLSIGLVVDDAIVMLENIYRHIERGNNPLIAAFKGIKEIKFAIIAMTLTLMAVYTPIIFASGLIGKLFTEFAVTLAGTVLISGVVALVLTPMLCSRILHSHDESKKRHWLEIKIDKFLEKIDEIYTWALRIAITKSKIVIFISILLGGFALIAYQFLHQTLIPETDTSYIIFDFDAPSGATADYMNRYAKKIEDIIKTIPEMKNYVISLQSRSANNHIYLKLVDLEKRKKTAKQILEEINKKLEGAQSGLYVMSRCYSGPLGEDESAETLSFTIQSHKTYDEMEAVVFTILNLLRTHPDIDSSIRTTRVNPEKAYKVKINKERAAQFNVRMQDIGEMLTFVLRGQPPADRFEKNGKRYPMRLMISKKFKMNQENLKQFHVRAIKGNNNEKQPPLVSLYELLEIEESEERPVAARFEGMRSYGVTCKMKKGNSVSFYKNFARLLKSEDILPPGYKISPTGETRKTIKEGRNILLVFILAILFIFLIMAAQFESFLDPLIIMFSVPLALAGGVLILLIVPNASLNIFTYIALITLVGLITKHGILLVEFANEILHKNNNYDKNSIENAIIEASILRLRPILMTTAAMVLGALPLALSRATDYEVRSQIGWVIVSGMSIGTLFTIFLIPCMYIIINRYKYKVRL